MHQVYQNITTLDMFIFQCELLLHSKIKGFSSNNAVKNPPHLNNDYTRCLK